jgi:hypothetical protein
MSPRHLILMHFLPHYYQQHLHRHLHLKDKKDCHHYLQHFLDLMFQHRLFRYYMHRRLNRLLLQT